MLSEIQQSKKGKIKVLKQSKGFTLLEGIIALGVITVGLIVGLTLAISNLLASQDNERRAIAANLAREGLEAVRNERDSNWLRRDLNLTHDDIYNNGDNVVYNWDDFLDSTDSSVGNHFVVNTISPTDIQHQLKDTSPSNITTMDDCVTDGYACRLKYQADSGIYGLTVGSEYSLYHRLITLQNICWDDTNNSEAVAALDQTCTDLDPSYQKVGVLVISHVRYVTNPGPNQLNHDVIAKERLYNWR